MLEEKKEAVKEPKAKIEKIEEVSSVEMKQYTVLRAVTLEKKHTAGDLISVKIGSDLEKYLVTNKIVNKHGISRSN